MKSSKKVQCYCCTELATTKDHVPPSCFFPKSKYLPNNSPNYRKNLLTVPACPKHNNFRSRDDEYTAVVIAMNSKSKLAVTMFKEKWVHTLLRREGLLGKRIFSTARDVRYFSRENCLYTPNYSVAISYEMGRIERVIKSIAYALYYLESNCQDKWGNDCEIISPMFRCPDLSNPKQNYFLNFVDKLFINGIKHEELGLEKKGNNPEVFYYQFVKLNKSYVIRLVFFDCFPIFALFKEEGAYFTL